MSVLTLENDKPRNIAITETWQLSRPATARFDAWARRHLKHVNLVGGPDMGFNARTATNLKHIAHGNMESFRSHVSVPCSMKNPSMPYPWRITPFSTFKSLPSIFPLDSNLQLPH
jgi:hypothetical protein